MAINTFPVTSSAKTRRIETLTSGTSWTVPTGVTYVNATLVGGGGGGGGASPSNSVYGPALRGAGGAVIESTVATTPGTNISYTIGAGGSGAIIGWPSMGAGGYGGNTTFSGATTALGGAFGGDWGITYGGLTGTSGLVSNNGGGPASGNSSGGTGGAGCIILEYWV